MDVLSRNERLIYRLAINDAREILIERGNKALDAGDSKTALVTGKCSRSLVELLDKYKD